MMNTSIKLILWNCRGAAGKEFFRFSKYFCDMYKPEIFVIMETRCDPLKLHKPLKKLGFNQFFSVENEGYAGGIIVACKDDKLKVTLYAQEVQWIHLNICNDEGIVWRCTLVYTSPAEQKRKVMWENLQIRANIENYPWIVPGDFNDIANGHEKKGGAQASQRRCSTFRNNLKNCKLHDMGVTGP